MSLETIRVEIDEIDRQIVALLDRRFAATRQAALAKQHAGKNLTDLSREAQVIRVAQHHARNTPDTAILSIFTAIISASKADQKRLLT